MLAKYEAALASNHFVSGPAPTQADAEAFNELAAHMNSISPATHPNVFGWICLVGKFNEKVRATWPAAGGDSKPAKKEKGGDKPKKEAKKPAADDDLDLFGEDDADADAAKAAAAKVKAAAQAKPKKVVVAMSIVMLEVKPLDDTTDLDALQKKILADITMDGLFWKTEYKKEPVAFGIYKLIIGFSLEDEKVSVDDIVERIEAMEEFVQSVEIASFNKI